MRGRCAEELSPLLCKRLAWGLGPPASSGSSFCPMLLWAFPSTLPRPAHAQGFAPSLATHPRSPGGEPLSATLFKTAALSGCEADASRSY